MVVYNLKTFEDFFTARTLYEIYFNSSRCSGDRNEISVPAPLKYLRIFCRPGLIDVPHRYKDVSTIGF